MAVVHEVAVIGSLAGWQAAPANAFVGTWRLVSCTAYRRSGLTVPIYGLDPQGRLFYDAAGNMSVQVMSTTRPNFKGGQKSRATAAELKAAFEGYEAYFATYEVDWSTGLINHRVQGGLFPNWTNSVQPRYFLFEGRDRLVLSTEPIDAKPQRRTIVTLVWERLS